MYDDRHASVAQAADEGEQPLDLLGGERRGRFVEHQQSCRSGHRPGDLEDLTLCHTELADRLTRVEVDVELPQHLHGASADGSPAYEPTAAGQRAEGDVLRNRQVGRVGELLVDDSNPRSRRSSVAHVDNLAIHRDRAGVGSIVAREHLDRRRPGDATRSALLAKTAAAYDDQGAHGDYRATPHDRGGWRGCRYVRNPRIARDLGFRVIDQEFSDAPYLRLPRTSPSARCQLWWFAGAVQQRAAASSTRPASVGCQLGVQSVRSSNQAMLDLPDCCVDEPHLGALAEEVERRLHLRPPPARPRRGDCHITAEVNALADDVVSPRRLCRREPAAASFDRRR